MAISNFQVYITPLKNDNQYATEVNVTDYVTLGGISNVSQSIDAGSYDIGLYTYADLTITLVNYDGRFNDEKDSASMFFYSRDRAKVRVVFIDEESGDNILFNGIINDEATTQDFIAQTVKVKALSRDSILRKTKVSGGLISNGMLLSAAIKALLNRPVINSVIGYDESKISVGIDLTIDDASVFSEKTTRTVLELLLNASGSVFRIDQDDDMVVSTRAANAIDDLYLYGGGDPLQRDNIETIKSFNNGLHRTFNTITVNEITASDDDFVERYGASIKSFDFDFITNDNKALLIAEYILEQFKRPKNELEVTVPVLVAKQSSVLDPVRVGFAKKYMGWKGSRVPLAGVAIAGQDVVPYSAGGIKIATNKQWKIIGINQDIKSFETSLRLREV